MSDSPLAALVLEHLPHIMCSSFYEGVRAVIMGRESHVILVRFDDSCMHFGLEAIGQFRWSSCLPELMAGVS